VPYQLNRTSFPDPVQVPHSSIRAPHLDLTSSHPLSLINRGFLPVLMCLQMVSACFGISPKPRRKDLAMSRSRIPIRRYRCLRCGHRWIPRESFVRVCPGCRSPYWDVSKHSKKKNRAHVLIARLRRAAERSEAQYGPARRELVRHNRELARREASRRRASRNRATQAKRQGH
jgi:hypothetical protein